jgi:phosphatidylglycerophosphate synthase
MANLVTLSRFFLVLAAILFAYGPPTPWRFATVALLIVAFATDAVDGLLARSRGETSHLGAMLDIAVDRIVEITLWIVLVDLALVPVWVPLVFVARGGFVDAIRGAASARQKRAPFDTIAGRFGAFIVAGSFVRTSYAVIKAVTFCWLFFLHALVPPVVELDPHLMALGQGIGRDLIYLSVAICLLRALPILMQYPAVAADPGDHTQP